MRVHAVLDGVINLKGTHFFPIESLYTELVVETWLPPLRVMVELFSIQVSAVLHLACKNLVIREH